MRMKAKTFDCVEMKNRIQARILSQYEAHKDEYTSFVDFVKARAGKSKWVRDMRKKLKACARVS